MRQLLEIAEDARRAKYTVAKLGTNDKNRAILAIADALVAHADEIIAANKIDIENGRAAGLNDGLIDRLMLDEKRIAGIAEGCRQVAALPDPVGEVLWMRRRPNGLNIGQKRVPMGVIGIIFSMIFIRYALRIRFEKEDEALAAMSNEHKKYADKISVQFTNAVLDGRTVGEMKELINRSFVISRIADADNHITVATQDSRLHIGDKLLIVCSSEDTDAITAFLGHIIDMPFEEWGSLDSQLVSRRILITKPSINGKKFADLHLRTKYGINITRVNRAGVDLIPYQGMELQVGDRVMVVGSEKAIAQVADLLGNSMKKLREPNLVTIFVGIALGVLLGSIPLLNVPQPVKLGLAGGPPHVGGPVP